MGWLTLLVYLTPIVVALYFYINNVYSYWTKKGVPSPPSIFPFGYVLTRFNTDAIKYEVEQMKKFGKVYGVYYGTLPTLTVASPELAKKVLVKDFHLLTDRRDLKVLDKHWNQNVSVVRGDSWKRIRSIITPSFSTGKLRRMFPLMKNVTDRLEKYLGDLCDKSDNSPLDIKSVVSGFTMEVIAATAFGTDTNTTDRSKFNPFLHHGQNFFMNISFLRTVAIMTMPEFLLKSLGIMHFFEHASYDFFVNVSKTMLGREAQNENLMSMLKKAHISEEELKNINYSKLTATSDTEMETEVTEKLDKTSKGSIKYLTDDEIIAQCIVFFSAGFETTASVITTIMFHLVENPEIQDRLYKEVTSHLAGIDPNNLVEYYEEINKIPYLEAIIKEALRMYPPTARVERSVGVDKYDMNGIELKRGDLIEVSVMGIHYDDECFENPYKFDAERFMPENKHKLIPYSYIPFGDGPRNCLGMRFAYQEVKICLSSIIQRFRFGKTEKTPPKLSFPTKNFVIFPYSFEISVSHRN